MRYIPFLVLTTVVFVAIPRASADTVNVALNGTPYSNRPLWAPGNWNIAMLNDGDKSSVFHADTAPGAGFAYSVDLGGDYAVKQLKIYPRQDGCCPERLRNFRVSIHTDNNGSLGAEVWGTDLFTDGSNAGSGPGIILEINPPSPQTGRWVQIKALLDPVPDYFLQMTELEVFADVAADQVNRALGAPASSNRPLYNGRSPQHLTDGDRAELADIIHGTDTIDPGFAYEINLGTTVALNKLVIWARQDGCCPERLSNYRVSVLTDNNGQPGNEVWHADLHTDGTNPGSSRGSKDVLTAALDAAGQFKGQWIRIRSLDDPVPSYALQMAEVEAYGVPQGPPSLFITRQPQDAVAGLGQIATFTVTAFAGGGDPNLITYQWQKDGVDIPGANGATYNTPPVPASEAGKKFRCLVAYPGLPGLTSAVATLNINVAYHTIATSNRPLWGGGQITQLLDGNRQNFFHLAEDPDAGAAYEVNLGIAYDLTRIVIWARQDGCCPQRLTNYRVSVHKDNNGKIGDEVWKADLHTDGTNPGSTPGSLDELTAALDPNGVFLGQWIRIQALDDPLPSYSLQMGELEVFGTPAAGVQLLITQQPKNTTAGLGQPATFTVIATSPGGDPSKITYQWQKEGVNIDGATNATYRTPPVTGADGGKKYRCVVAYPGLASLTSDEASFRINLAQGAAVISNRPLWIPGGWNTGLIVDGNPSTFVHGDVDIQAGFAYEIQLNGVVQMNEIDIYPRQDGCCPERLSNIRVSVHKDNHGAIGDPVWSADLFTDGSNPGSAPGVVVQLTKDLNAAGTFEGQWIRILALDDPVPNYFLQIADVQVFGTLLSTPTSVTLVQQPLDAASAPFRSAKFSVGVKVLNGDPAQLIFQWQRDQANIPGASSATYRTPPLVAADENSKYRCVISYPGQPDIVSAEAKLTFDYDYAKGTQAFSNRPLWDGFNIATLVDGDTNGVIHGDTQIAPGFAYTINMGLAVAIDRIDIYPRQDGCCPERLANFRVSVHKDNNGQIGDPVWSADLFTDGSNAGSGPGTVVSLAKDLDANGKFEGQWIRIMALSDSVPDYDLQMTEVEVIGKVNSVPPQFLPRVTIRRDQTGITLTWDSGMLESATDLGGQWAPVADAKSPFPVQSAGRRQFYRLKL